ncbi:Transmembrane amino acid transporter protein [Trichostrongylus colubriformis]|uniref:Transmembrane amino acid transporter protein n=1 Tax=Trichostrongylus colubriformis TaxID=6319 RepID=A0AAN8EVW6_TRICO
MMGVSLLCMPWGLHQAGFAFGLVIHLLMCLLCLYTAYLVAKSPTALEDEGVTVLEFHEICKVYLRREDNMHPINGIRTHQENGRCHVHCHTENTFLSNISRRNDPPLFLGLTFDDVWQLQLTVPIYLVILIFPLLNFKSPTFFAKFNVLGTISVVYLLFINGIRLVTCGFSMNFSDTTSPNYVQNFNWNFPALTGMLTLSFFIHNCIITLLRNQRYPENNVRDLSIGYGLVAFSYIFVGLTFYVTFPLPKSCIDDNLLNNFEEHDPLSAIARVLIFFQLLTILPLVAYFIRSQISCAIFKTPWPG